MGCHADIPCLHKGTKVEGRERHRLQIHTCIESIDEAIKFISRKLFNVRSNQVLGDLDIVSRVLVEFPVTGLDCFRFGPRPGLPRFSWKSIERFVHEVSRCEGY